MAQKGTDYRPTKAERLILDSLLDPANRLKTVTELCATLGIGRRTFYNVFSKPEFVELYKTKSAEVVKQHMGPVINAFIREAKRGSFQHGKVVLEMLGIYNPDGGKDDKPDELGTAVEEAWRRRKANVES